MRALAEARWWAALLAVAASCLTLQAAPAGPQVELTVRARPDSAFVYASSHDRPQPVLLGRVNRPLALAASRFQGGVLFTLGGGPPRPDGTIPELAGYQSASFPATNPIYAGARSPGAAGSYLYPAPGQDELQLAPEPGLAGWWHRHSGEVATGLVLLALAGLVRFRRSARPALAALRRRAPQRKVRPQRMNTEDDIYVGRTFGAWTTTARLGAGGMATVYRAVSKRSGGAELAAAIKVMNPVLLRDDEYRKRFSREIAIWSRLNHPHVVRMIDSGETDEVLYLVMELVEGKTLRALLPENGMPLPQALHYAIGICQGLAYAHGQGVVHRDLKPDNVMVNRSGQIKITDLGLAKQESSENLTLKGDTFGTPAYMAPEQITGGTLLPASDQYGLAVMLFEMLTGRRPFHVPDSVTLVMKHLQEAPPRVRTVKTQLPQELDALIDRMLEKDPARRMPDMESVSEQLRAIRRRYCPE